MSNNTKIESSIIKKLHSLRSAIRWRIAIEGFAWIIIALVCLIVGTMLLDFTLKLELELRAFFLALFALGVLIVFIRTIILPMFVKMDDENLALLVEKRNPLLKDRLISSLQFSKSTAQIDRGISPELINKVHEQTNELASKIDFKTFIEKTQALKVWGLSILLVLMVGAFSYARSDIMGLWFQRNILLKNVDWPQETYLGVYYIDRAGALKPVLELNENGDIVKTVKEIPVLRGDNLRVVALNLASSKAPEEVKCWIDYPSSGRAEATAKKPSDKNVLKYSAGLTKVLRDQKNVKFYELKFNNVRESFEFYVYGGDDSRDSRSKHKIKLVESPSLTNLKIVETFHPYLKRSGIYKTEVHNPSQDVIEVKLGSKLTFEGVSTKDLSKAWIEVDGVKAGVVKIENVKVDKKDQPRRFVGNVTLDEKLLFEHKEGTKTLKDGLNVKLKLVDSDNFINKRGEKFEFEIKPDNPADISIEQKVVRDMICPQATIPIRIKAKDDNGIENIQVYYQVVIPKAGKNGKDKLTKWLKIGEKLTMSDRSAEDDEYQLTVTKNFEIKTPKLKPLMLLRFKAVVKDSLLDSFGGPNESTSNEIEFTIVSRDHLYSMILDNQSQYTVEFKQALITQAASNGKIILASDLLSSGKNILSAKNKIKQAMQSQAEVQETCANLAKRYEALMKEMELNKIGKKEQLEKVRKEIVQLLDNSSDKVNPILEQAQKAIDESGRNQVLEKSIYTSELQTDLLKLLNQIFNNMEQCTSLIQFQQSLEALIGEGKELGKEIGDLDSSQTDDLFEEDEEAEKAEEAAKKAEELAKEARKLAAEASVEAELLAKKAESSQKPEDKEKADTAKRNAAKLQTKAKIAEKEAKKARKKADQY